MPVDVITQAIASLSALSEHDRIAAYNAVQRSLAKLVSDVCPDPAAAPQLVAAELVDANDYNPNSVASTELDLLETSMRADGITMAVVVVLDEATGRATVVDGFHRRTVARERLGRKFLPCSVIDRPIADRMASTVRHNRARGKHAVDLMGSLVRSMMSQGWDDARIAHELGMSVEELLRLKQTVGAARMLAAQEYGRAWRGRDGENHPHEARR